jgi:uncharacterized protein YsxB (DUF464 family)
MININIIRDKEGFVWEFTIEGHADAGEEGKDIVCAAVSAVAYTALGALGELAGIEQYIEEDGYMNCHIPLDIAGEEKYKAQIILDTMVIGFKQIEFAYKKFVSVMDEEV